MNRRVHYATLSSSCATHRVLRKVAKALVLPWPRANRTCSHAAYLTQKGMLYNRVTPASLACSWTTISTLLLARMLQARKLVQIDAKRCACLIDVDRLRRRLSWATQVLDVRPHARRRPRL